MKKFKDLLFVFCAVAIAATSITAAVIFRSGMGKSSSTRDDSRSRSPGKSRIIADDSFNRLFGRTGPEDGDIGPVKLEFRLVHWENDTVVPRYVEYRLNGGDPVTCPYVPYNDAEILVEESRDPKTHELKTEYTLVEKEVQMTGDDINDSYVLRDEFGKYEIMIYFNRKGTADFADLTGRNVGRRLAIVIDGQLYSAPVLRTMIDDGTAVITGDFSLEEAKRVSAALRRGRRSKGKD